MPYKSGKNLGYTKAEIRGIEKFLEHLHNEFGEYELVIRTTGGEEIQISYIRRELSLERSVNKTIQKLKEAPKAIHTSFNFDGYTITAGDGGLMGTDWYPRPRTKTGNEPDKI